MAKYSYTFSIPKPCSESWLNMSAEEKGNFCHNCQKVVMDFSRMTDEEIIRTIKNTKGSICGRFNNTQLNRPMYFTYSTNVQRPYPLKAILAGIIALTLIQPANLEASVLPVNSTIVQSRTSSNPFMLADTTVAAAVTDTLKGRVVEENFGLGISEAKIYIEGSKDTASADAEGRFSIAIPPQFAGKSFKIEVIIWGTSKSYFLVTPEELSSTREQVFVISHEHYAVDGMMFYDEDPEPEPEPEIIKHQEIDHVEIKKRKK